MIRLVAAAVVGVATVWLQACARADDDSELAIEWGTYSVGAPRCASTDASPAYPAANYRAALFDFADLTRRELALDRHEVVETFVDEDCTLVVTRRVHTNLDGRYSVRKGRTHVFVPEGCELAVEAGGESQAVGKAYTTLFTDSDDLSQELPWDVSRAASADGYELVTSDDPTANALWGPFGCAASDRLRVTLTRAAD